MEAIAPLKDDEGQEIMTIEKRFANLRQKSYRKVESRKNELVNCKVSEFESLRGYINGMRDVLKCFDKEFKNG